MMFHPNPFGSVMQGRNWTDVNRNYRYGFNGKEKDFETADDNYDFGARIYDGRLGRWLSLDPLYRMFPYLNPYNFCANIVVLFKDIDGKILKPANTESFEILKGLISDEELKYFKLNEDGTVDVALMLRYIVNSPPSNVSNNFRMLLTLAKSIDVYNFTEASYILINKINESGEPIVEDFCVKLTNTPTSEDPNRQSGLFGVNIFEKIDPNVSYQTSSIDGQNWIIVNPAINSVNKKEEVAAHELVHAYLYELRDNQKRDVIPYHDAPNWKERNKLLSQLIKIAVTEVKMLNEKGITD